MNRKTPRRLTSLFEILVASLLVAGCGDPTSVPVILTAEVPLHLEGKLP